MHCGTGRLSVQGITVLHGVAALPHRDATVGFGDSGNDVCDTAPDLVVHSPVVYAVKPSAIHLSVLPNLCSDSESDLQDIAVPLESWIDKPNYELPDLTFQLVVMDKLGGTRPRSDPVSILPFFSDTGDPKTVLPVPKLRHPVQVLDFASDIDPGPGPYFKMAGRPRSRLTCGVYLNADLEPGGGVLQSGWIFLRI